MLLMGPSYYCGVVLMLLTFLSSGCSVRSIAVDMTASIMNEGAKAFEEESDLEFAEQSIGGNLKVLEALLKNSPRHPSLLIQLAKSYGGYAFAFIEDKYEAYKFKNPELAEYHKKRAGQFYLRGKEFALRYLKEKNADFESALEKDFETFEKVLQDFDEDEVEGLFWAAYNWGNWVNMNLHEPDAIAAAPRVESMMKRVLVLNEKFYFAGPHLFYGVYYGGRPPMLGGDKSKSKVHFNKALAFSERKLLITQVLYAQYYAVQMQDQILFRKLLQEVIQADDFIFPEQNLITQVAKRKAKRLLARQKDLF